MKYATLILFFLIVSSARSETLFPSSVVSNDIDFIRTGDFTEKSVLKFKGVLRQEMPDKRTDKLFDDAAFVFEVNFADDTSLGIWASSKFSNRSDAEEYVKKILGPLGRLPAEMRNHLSHIVILKGDESAFAKRIERFFVLYSENILTRLSNNELEETIFYETVHATLDYSYK